MAVAIRLTANKTKGTNVQETWQQLQPWITEDGQVISVKGTSSSMVLHLPPFTPSALLQRLSGPRRETNHSGERVPPLNFTHIDGIN